MGDLATLVQELKVRASIPDNAQFNETEDGLANIYTFEIKPGFKAYRYDVELTDMVKDKSLTGGAGDDGKKQLLRNICHELVMFVHNTTQNFGTEGRALFVYDNRKILFTNQQVQPMIVEIPSDRMSDFCRRFLNNASVNFELQACRDHYELDLADVRPALQPYPHEQADHSLRNFLGMLTSQSFLNDGTHKLVGAGKLFEVNEAERGRINDAITSHNGVAKGVRIIVNGDVKPCPALVADVKRCAFFVRGNLERIAQGMIQNAAQRRRLNPQDPQQMAKFWADFGAIYKGVSAYLTYDPSRVIVIDSISQRLCQDISFEVDGRQMTMTEFFQEKKNVHINGQMPAVRQHKDREALYPLACLEILPFQRLPLDKMNINEEMAEISRTLLAANSTAPHDRFRAIENEMKKIGQAGLNCGKFMMQWGIRLKGGRNDVVIGMRPLPPIQFGGNRQQQQDNQGRFDVRGPMRYLEPSQVLRNWVVAHPRRVAEGQFQQFLQRLGQMANARGMAFPEPRRVNIEVDELEQAFAKMNSEKVQYCMYIDNKFVKSHSSLKLCERKHWVLTQHVTVELVQKAGPASISNVLNKMNMKLFGLNYMPLPDPVLRAKFDLSSGKVLVIGIDTSRPPRATAFEKFQLRKSGMEGFESADPMVVGWCANYVKSPYKFAGDYYYQPCKQDMLDPHFLTAKMEWTLAQVKRTRAKAPEIIFVIRDGVSEGMVPNLIGPEGEFHGFVEACRRFAPNWSPKFIYCIVDKSHNKRFFVRHTNGGNGGGGGNGNGNGNGQVQNTMPGAVIDRKFVRVDMHEFFLQAHYPLKGCSKIPQYVFPINQIKANNEELQAFLHSLCNMWQIVNLAPALPTPVRQAKELAKRGRNNYVEMKRNFPRAIPHVAGTPHIIDFAALNTRLGYAEHKVLFETRFNA